MLFRHFQRVAPLVGAWIEITPACKIFGKFLSLPLWERGLKSILFALSDMSVIVAPLVGAWIEILCLHLFYSLCLVAPLVGAWIEIAVLVLSST